MLTKIKNWLEGTQDFQIGIDLLKSVGATSSTWNILNAGENSFSRQLLADKLSLALQANLSPTTHKEVYPAILTVENLYKPEKNHTAAAHIQKKVFGNINREELPKQLHSLYDELRPLYSKAEALKPQLKHFDQPHRGQMCKEIMRCRIRINQIWEKLNHWHRTGELPDGRSVEMEDDLHSKYIRLMQILQNHPGFISKNQKNPKKAAEVEQRIKELDYAKEVLKNGRII